MKGPDPQILFSSFLQISSMREYCYSLARAGCSAPPTNGCRVFQREHSRRGREAEEAEEGANEGRHAREAVSMRIISCYLAPCAKRMDRPMKAMWRPHQPRKLRRPAQRSTSTTLLTLPRKCSPWKIFAISRERLLVPALPQAMQRPGP